MANQMLRKFKFAYKEEYPSNVRQWEAKRVAEKFPDRIALILERHSDSKLGDLDKKQFLVPKAMTVGQLHYLIHTRLALDDGEKLVFLVDGKSGIPNATTPMETLYKDCRDQDDLLLYMCYCEAALCGGNDENYEVGELARFLRECKVECNVAAIEGAIM